MSRRPCVNPLQFAAAKQILEGCEPIGNFERLAQETVNPDSLLHYRIEGSKDKMGRTRLLCGLEGRIDLTCQRCLGLYEHTIDVHKIYYPVATAKELEDLERVLAVDANTDIEVIEAGRSLDLAALIEDEILLGLPVIPMHAEGACHAPSNQVS